MECSTLFNVRLELVFLFLLFRGGIITLNFCSNPNPVFVCLFTFVRTGIFRKKLKDLEVIV